MSFLLEFPFSVSMFCGNQLLLLVQLVLVVDSHVQMTLKTGYKSVYNVHIISSYQTTIEYSNYSLNRTQLECAVKSVL